MILWRTDANYEKKSLIIWSTIKVVRVRRCSRNCRNVLLVLKMRVASITDFIFESIG